MSAFSKPLGPDDDDVDDSDGVDLDSDDGLPEADDEIVEWGQRDAGEDRQRRG